MPVVRSSDLSSGTVTQSLRPSKLRALPKRPVVRRGPLSLPALPVPDASVAVAPADSSKPQAPTSLADGGKTGGGSGKTLGGVSAGGDGVGDGLALGDGLGLGLGLGLGDGD